GRSYAPRRVRRSPPRRRQTRPAGSHPRTVRCRRVPRWSSAPCCRVRRSSRAAEYMAGLRPSNLPGRFVNDPRNHCEETPLMPSTVILGTARTPFGKMGGALSSLDATDLGGTAISAALERADVDPEQVEEVVYGQVLQAGQGQIPSRQAQIKAGIPK